MATFKNVEDYIEFIGGYRNAEGLLIYKGSAPIKLARYDVDIVNSFCLQLMQHRPLTEKQSQLALRIALKYKKQMSKMTPPVYIDDDLNSFRLGIRAVDKTKSITIVDDEIVIKFPYDQKLIDIVKKYSREGCGTMRFNADKKQWHCAITEHHVNWLMTIAAAHDFKVDPVITDLFEKIIAVEAQPFNIQLVKQGDELTIINAADSLLNYVSAQVGALTMENLPLLVDYGPVLGYKVDESLKKEIDKSIGYDLVTRKLWFKRTATLSKIEFGLEANEDSILQAILHYARKVNRLPVYVYNITTPKKNSDEVIYLNQGVDASVKPRLLVTFSNVMIGNKKLSWVLNSEKMITIE